MIDNFTRGVTEKLPDKVLEDGTIIETTVTTYPTRKVTVENNITPKMQEEALAKVEAEIAEKTASIEKYSTNLAKPIK